jgi:hypothetical protein
VIADEYNADWIGWNESNPAPNKQNNKAVLRDV